MNCFCSLLWRIIYCIGFQIVTCQWLLKVELHQFRNFYNVESIEGGLFCCCDIVTTFDTCKSPNALNATCAAMCDTSFQVRLLDCKDPNACQVTMTTDVVENSVSITNTSYQVGFFFKTFPNKKVWKPSFMNIAFSVRCLGKAMQVWTKASQYSLGTLASIDDHINTQCEEYMYIKFNHSLLACFSNI